MSPFVPHPPTPCSPALLLKPNTWDSTITSHCTKYQSDLEGVASLNPSRFQHTACFCLPCLFSSQPHPGLQLVQWPQVVAQCHGWDIAQRGLWVLRTKSSLRSQGPQGHLPLSLCSFFAVCNQEPAYIRDCVWWEQQECRDLLQVRNALLGERVDTREAC